MFGIGIGELIVIMIIAFVVVGPEKLPGIARSLGKGLYEIRRATDEVREEIEREGLPDELQGDKTKEPIAEESEEKKFEETRRE